MSELDNVQVVYITRNLDNVQVRHCPSCPSWIISELSQLRQYPAWTGCPSYPCHIHRNCSTGTLADWGLGRLGQVLSCRCILPAADSPLESLVFVLSRTHFSHPGTHVHPTFHALHMNVGQEATAAAEVIRGLEMTFPSSLAMVDCTNFGVSFTCESLLITFLNTSEQLTCIVADSTVSQSDNRNKP